MGLELKKCLAVIKDDNYTGQLHVDSRTLEFRSPDLKWSIKVGIGTSAKVLDGMLLVRRGNKSGVFRIGKNANRWADKVVNPPPRGKKLGLKSEQRFVVRGEFHKSFEKELLDHGLVKARGPKSCDIAFVLMNRSAGLKVLDKIATSIPKSVHIWAVWPKGIDGIRQSDVIATARKHGMGPGKGISFDETYSAMRFTKK